MTKKVIAYEALYTAVQMVNTAIQLINDAVQDAQTATGQAQTEISNMQNLTVTVNDLIVQVEELLAEGSTYTPSYPFSLDYIDPSGSIASETLPEDALFAGNIPFVEDRAGQKHLTMYSQSVTQGYLQNIMGGSFQDYYTAETVLYAIQGKAFNKKNRVPIGDTSEMVFRLASIYTEASEVRTGEAFFEFQTFEDQTITRFGFPSNSLPSGTFLLKLTDTESNYVMHSESVTAFTQFPLISDDGFSNGPYHWIQSSVISQHLPKGKYKISMEYTGATFAPIHLDLGYYPEYMMKPFLEIASGIQSGEDNYSFPVWFITRELKSAVVGKLPLGKVDNSGASLGDLAQWDGSAWVPLGSGASIGDFLTWNGSAWVPETLNLETPARAVINHIHASGLAEAASVTTNINLEAAGHPYNRFYGIRVQVTGFTDAGQKARVEIWGTDTFTVDRQYSGVFDDGSFEGSRGTVDNARAWDYRDLDNTKELHLKVINEGSGALPGLTITITMEPF